MNILVIGKFYEEGFALHIAETLSFNGNNVIKFEAGFRSQRYKSNIGNKIEKIIGAIYTSSDNIPKIRSIRMENLWSLIRGNPIDIVIVSHDFLWPSEVKELKVATGAAVVMWFPDSLANFKKGYFMTAEYDAVFFKDPYIVKILNKIITPPVYYLPECFNPYKHNADSILSIDPKYICDITTAGSQHSYRVSIFKHLVNYNVKIWGPRAPLWMDPTLMGKMYMGESVFNEDKAAAFLGAKIVLNTLFYGEIWGLNARAFEAAGIGAFQLLDWRPGLNHLFEDGREVISFNGINDLKNKIDYWLPRSDERREISLAAKAKALNFHTYQHRLDLMFKTISGSEDGYSFLPND